MVTVRASSTWDGPAVDILRVFAEPSPVSGAEVHDEDVVFYRALDEGEEPTGDITGVEIIGFLSFDRWDELPSLSIRWQLPGWEPLSLPDLLKRKQQELQQRHKSEVA